MQQTVTEAVAPIRHSLELNASPARAFGAFTGEMGRWWPKNFGIGGVPLADVVIEPRVKGRYYERGDDGSQTPWGEVIAWEQPTRVVLAWRINERFAYDGDLHTEVEVRFEDAGAGRCRVTFEHRGLGALGAAAEAARAQLDSGWAQLLQLFKSHAEA